MNPYRIAADKNYRETEEYFPIPGYAIGQYYYIGLSRPNIFNVECDNGINIESVEEVSGRVLLKIPFMPFSSYYVIKVKYNYLI